jgi:type II secretory pathway pseudopilin PulG
MLRHLERRLEAARSRELGESLIELIMAIAIISITAVALIGSVLTSITSSSSHRTLTDSDTYLKSYANAAAQQIQRQANPLYNANATTYSVTKPADIPSTYTVGITSVKYWSSGSWVNSFPGGKPAQLVTVGVQSPTQVSTTMSFAVRNPNDLG